jgi:hypothetical protein
VLDHFSIKTGIFPMGMACVQAVEDNGVIEQIE